MPAAAGYGDPDKDSLHSVGRVGGLTVVSQRIGSGERLPSYVPFHDVVYIG